MQGYDNFDVASNIWYGGCAIYARCSFGAILIKSLTMKTDSCEYIYIKIPKQNGSEPLTVGVYYTLPYAYLTSSDEL